MCRRGCSQSVVITTVRLHVASELIETSTYIQIVNATDNIPTVPQLITVTLP